MRLCNIGAIAAGLPSQFLPGSTVFDLRAADASGQLWAEHNGTTAYDMQLGATSGVETSDPSINAGPPPYIGFDGGDYLVLSGSNTAWVNALHHKGQHWLCAVGKFAASAFTNEEIMSTWGLGASDVGFTLGKASNQLALRFDDGTNLTSYLTGASTFPADGRDMFIGISWNTTVINQPMRVVMNTFTKSNSGVSITNIPTSGDPTYKFTAGATGRLDYKMNSGARLYALSGGDGYLSVAELQAIRDGYAAALGLTFS